MEEDLLNPNSNEPIYNNIHIQLATFIGGPLAIVYILAENYKRLGYPEKVRRTWVLGIAGIFIFSVLAAFITTRWKIPSLVFPLVFLSIGAAIMQALQGRDIKAHVDTGGPVYSYGRALAVGLICLLAILTLLMIFLMIAYKGQIPK